MTTTYFLRRKPRPAGLAALAGLLSLAACSGGNDDGRAGEQTAGSAAADRGSLAASGKTYDPGTLSELEVAELAQESELLEMVLEDVEPMSPLELSRLIPDSLAGMQRVDADATPQQTLGRSVTTAAADYAGDGNTSLRLSITDLGGMLGLARLGMQWIDAEGQTDGGFERTGVYQGFKTFEKYDASSAPGNSELRIFVGERFVVELLGEGIAWETMTAAADGVDLGQLDQIRRAAAP